MVRSTKTIRCSGGAWKRLWDEASNDVAVVLPPRGSDH
jgi:hypothetical protein